MVEGVYWVENRLLGLGLTIAQVDLLGVLGSLKNPQSQGPASFKALRRQSPPPAIKPPIPLMSSPNIVAECNVGKPGGRACHYEWD